MALKSSDVAESIFRLEVWLDKDKGGFYEITRMPQAGWDVTLFPKKQTSKIKNSWVTGKAKTLKTAVDRALKELEKVSD